MPFASVKYLNNKVIVRFQDSPSSDNDIQDYLKQLHDIYCKKKPFIILYDCTRMGMVTWNQASLQASFMKSHESLTKQYMKRCAIAINSPLGIQFLKMIFKIQPPVCPLRIFDNVKDAKAYLRAYSMKSN